MTGSVRRALRARYYDVLMTPAVGARFDRYALTYHLRRVFATLAIDCVLDVGANRGQYYDFLRESVGYTGHVVSFEPVAHNARILAERSRDDARWTVRDVALGRVAGPLEVKVPASDKLASFLALKPERGSIERTETVNVATLDDILPGILAELGTHNVFLKTDTQGFDLEVLVGAARVLPSILAVQTEASFQAQYEGAPHFADMLAYLTERGFLPVGMFPVDRDDRGRLIECDLVVMR